ncbi:hypothetical protein DFH06DRAFT_1026821, partial [Mycena polygramma]
LELPDDTPQWLSNALLYIRGADLGCHYASLLRALVRLEESAGFENDDHTPLPASKHRPTQVQKWIQGKRGEKMKTLPEVKNVVTYSKQWYKWWDDLQPSWRQRDANGKWITGGEYGSDWGKLDCAGINGSLSIVAALYFWGAAPTHTEETRAVWNEAVEDVTWILEGVDTLFE